MRQDQDVIERLAAADPMRDAEQLTPEDQREADALLERLLATPEEPAAAPRSPGSRLRRGALLTTGAACAAVAALAAVDLLDSDTPAPGVVDKAVAAVTRAGVVYHVVEFIDPRVSHVDVPEEVPPKVIAESWYTSDGRHHRKGFSVRDGEKDQLMEDFAGRRVPGRRFVQALVWQRLTNRIGESGLGGAGEESVPTLDSFQDPGSQLRALQQEGRLTFAGTTEVDGERAYRLSSDEIEMRGDRVRVEFTVDAETYLPLTKRLSLELANGAQLDTDIVFRVYEQLPVNDETSKLLALDPHPGAKCSEFAHGLTEERDLGYPNPCARDRGR